MSVPKSVLLTSLIVSSAEAFSSSSSSSNSAFLMTTQTKSSTSLAAASMDTNNNDKPIFDPLNLYGKNSLERKSGRIRGLEPQLKVIKPVLDPLNLYSNKAEVDVDVDMSDSLPFLPRPASLTGELVGDVGFDPFNYADTDSKLAWQREAELKHSRIAMLAVIGWPLSELLHQPLAQMFHLDDSALLGSGDRVPSILNGGLDRVNPLFRVAGLGVASAVELFQMKNNNDSDAKQLLWDPLGMYPANNVDQKKIEMAEINHGRLAMLAITGFAVQEFFSNQAVVAPLLHTHF